MISRSYVDYMIGELVEETKTLKLYNDTTIVFWTDHGYKLGEHCDWFKHDNVRRLHEPHSDVFCCSPRCQYVLIRKRQYAHIRLTHASCWTNADACSTKTAHGLSQSSSRPMI